MKKGSMVTTIEPGEGRGKGRSVFGGNLNPLHFTLEQGCARHGDGD